MRRELVRQAVAASLMESKVIVSPSCNSTQGTWHEGMQANGSRNLISITRTGRFTHPQLQFVCIRMYSRQDLGRCTHILTDVYCIYVHTNKLARMCCMHDDHQLQATFDNIQTQYYIIMHLEQSRMVWLRAKTCKHCMGCTFLKETGTMKACQKQAIH